MPATVWASSFGHVGQLSLFFFLPLSQTGNLQLSLRHSFTQEKTFQLLLSLSVLFFTPTCTLGLRAPGPTCSMLSELQYTYTLDAATLDQSIVNSGGGSHRFNAFLHKVLNHPAGARPLNVVVQGGSFSLGLGFSPGLFYAQKLVENLRSMNPAAKIVLTNSAVGELNSDSKLVCALVFKLVPKCLTP